MPAAAKHQKSAQRELDEPAPGSSHAHELELKRIRGEIPCAECKRCVSVIIAVSDGELMCL
jgi:hypothetical protein